MSDTKKQIKLKDLLYGIDKISEEDLSRLLSEKEKKFNKNLVDILKLKNELSISEKKKFLDNFIKNKELFFDSWIYSKEINNFCKDFKISKKDRFYYGLFFLEKIYNFFLLSEKEKESLDKYFFTTKFFDFIRVKNIELEDLLKMIIYFKNIILDNLDLVGFKYVNYISSTFDEISTRLSKNYNDTIIKLLNQHKFAIEQSNIISKTDINGYITYANEEFCAISGYKIEELIGKSHNIIRHPDTPKALFKELWDTIQAKKIWKGNIKNRKKDGSSYWVKSTIVPILDENNNILEYIAIRTDITELVEANKSVDEYTNALNESNLVLKLDNSGVIIDVNDSFCKTFAYKEEDLLGKVYINMIGVDIEEDLEDFYRETSGIALLNKKTLEELLASTTKKHTWKGVIKNKSKYGVIIWCSTTIIPILNSSDEIKEFIIIKTDISDIEIAKQNLKRSFDKLKELDIKKDEFLNIASHELRTPMTSVKGYISMILDGDAGEISEEARMYLDKVYKSSERLLNLINDMLDISKIESDKQEFTYEKVDIRKLLDDVSFDFKHLFKNKNQIFEINIDYDKFELNTDLNKLKQVIINILGNAIKFTPDNGTIKLSSKVINNEIEIIIKDSGIGINKNHLGVIFEKFGQVKNSLTRDINGTGLGLPIAKAIIERLGGRIMVESEEGLGTEFIIKLPI